ncbi:E3 ubiquitin-protein ligase SGR9 [Pyrus ussuriensis x Pyrus communis]|uniref:E3 ubiquitin-protein ligase SGR9 n=1 Tax=Pyrus ussuriensis x Pyrus communis TaxID=2448454 RepID=A0A5N5H502_9ROSA|nr:E3 ubiquitin-protein ligase SGR9 [Pyrus ussuriensis x Pyrus communis]
MVRNKWKQRKMEKQKTDMEEREGVAINSGPARAVFLSNRTILSNTHHHHRLSFLLSSSILFSLTLHCLNSLPLTHKTLLIANHIGLV